MKSLVSFSARRLWLLGLLAMLSLFGCGCTAALWDKDTFAHYSRPARPTTLRLFYSKERKDVLVQYSESRQGDTNSGLRSYWLEPNTPRVNSGRKPHFVSVKAARGLTPIPVSETDPRPAEAGPMQLYAMARPDDDYFTLYSGEEKLDHFKLPTYVGASQTVKQVLLTPFAVAVDATIIGGVIGYYCAPQLFASLSK